MTYKDFTKAIANRQRQVLPKLIHKSQTNLVQGCNIIENIIITREVIHSMRTKQHRKGWMAMKIGMEKVYDRLSYNFIEVHRYNFYACNLEWRSRSTLQSKKRDSQRGLFVPYPFVLYMEHASHKPFNQLVQGSGSQCTLGRWVSLISFLLT